MPDLLFIKVPEAKAGKNRLHLDLRPDDQAAEVARLESLGAARADVGQGDGRRLDRDDRPGGQRVLRAPAAHPGPGRRGGPDPGVPAALTPCDHRPWGCVARGSRCWRWCWWSRERWSTSATTPGSTAAALRPRSSPPSDVGPVLGSPDDVAEQLEDGPPNLTDLPDPFGDLVAGRLWKSLFERPSVGTFGDDGLVLAGPGGIPGSEYDGAVVAADAASGEARWGIGVTGYGAGGGPVGDSYVTLGIPKDRAPELAAYDLKTGERQGCTKLGDDVDTGFEPAARLRGARRGRRRGRVAGRPRCDGGALRPGGRRRVLAHGRGHDHRLRPGRRPRCRGGGQPVRRRARPTRTRPSTRVTAGSAGSPRSTRPTARWPGPGRTRSPTWWPCR